MPNKEIDKAYDVNKKIFHSMPENYGGELHHIFGRMGYLKACRRFFVKGGIQHHVDWEWIGKMRAWNRKAKEYSDQNYLRGMGCAEALFSECFKCPLLMKPKGGNNDK